MCLVFFWIKMELENKHRFLIIFYMRKKSHTYKLYQFRKAILPHEKLTN